MKSYMNTIIRPLALLSLFYLTSCKELSTKDIATLDLDNDGVKENVFSYEHYDRFGTNHYTLAVEPLDAHAYDVPKELKSFDKKPTSIEFIDHNNDGFLDLKYDIEVVDPTYFYTYLNTNVEKNDGKGNFGDVETIDSKLISY